MIEKASYADLAEILTLQKLAYQSEAKLYDDFEIQPLAQTLEEIKQEFTNQTFLKEVLDGKIIGSIRAFEQQGVCHIGKIMVHPDYQNKGIGKALIKSVEKYFPICSRYSLFTGNKSLKNLHLYESLGYKVIKEEKVNEKLTLLSLQKNNK